MADRKALFALALLQIDGIGRVTAGRLLSHFDSFEDLHRYPREQVLVRIKGTRNAQSLVNRLFDDAFVNEQRDKARRHLDRLNERHVQVLVQDDAHWPESLNDLPRADRPVLFYAFGAAQILSQPSAAFLARPPLSQEPFEQAQDLVRHLIDRQIPVISGVAHGFDNVVQKLCLSEDSPIPSIMVANCGLAKIPAGLRPTASQAVRSGSLMLSSFPMGHGPYDHDDFERALIQTALSHTAVFLEPKPDTPEWRALQWALETDRIVFAFPHPDHPLPEQVYPLPADSDFDQIAKTLTQE